MIQTDQVKEKKREKMLPRESVENFVLKIGKL